MPDPCNVLSSLRIAFELTWPNSLFAHDVILILGAILVDSTDYLSVYSETVVSLYYFIVSLSVLWMLILRSMAQQYHKYRIDAFVCHLFGKSTKMASIANDL